MVTLDEALQATRATVDSVIAAGEASGEAWARPRAPGKWSPAQIVEHVARSLEESANDVSGAPSRLPTFPSFVRPFVRSLLFNRVLRKQAFPKARTNKAMNPASGPDTPAAARLRLDEACASFERACRTAASRGDFMTSTMFGSVSIVDYVRFQDLHTRHHLRQMTESSAAPVR